MTISGLILTTNKINKIKYLSDFDMAQGYGINNDTLWAQRTNEHA